MLEIKPDTRLALAEDIMIQAIPELDYYFAFNITNGDQFQLNHTAHWVLDSIVTIPSCQTLITKFAQAFDIELQKAKEDLVEIVQFACQNNIIKELKV